MAGRIDSVDGGFVRGWIYDSRSPRTAPKLRVLVNGIQQSVASCGRPRPDIAALTSGSGECGFDIPLIEVIDRADVSAEIRLVLESDKRYALGPVWVTRPPQEKRRADGALAQWSSGSSSLAEGTIEQQLNHIFAHITATYEDTRMNFDQIHSLLFSLTGREPTKLTSSIRMPGAEPAMSKTQSRIAGVGVFDARPLDDQAEEDLMAFRIRSHLSSKALTN